MLLVLRGSSSKGGACESLVWMANEAFGTWAALLHAWLGTMFHQEMLSLSAALSNAYGRFSHIGSIRNLETWLCEYQFLEQRNTAYPRTDF